MPTEGNSTGSNENAPVRSAVDIAMAGERPMDTAKAQEVASAPVQTALEKAMAGERPPISHNTTEEVLPWNQSQGSSQTPLDLNNYNTGITHSDEEVIQNWDKNMSNTPSVMIATEKSAEKKEETKAPVDNHLEELRRFRDQTNVGPGESLPVTEPDRKDGMAEAAQKEKLHQEALDRNTKANEGFTGSMTQTGRNALRAQDTISELAKENATLMERLDKMQATLDKLLSGSAVTYNQDPALAAALDPNNPDRTDYGKPLRDAHDPMNKSLNETQIQFAKDVAEEDRLHNPLNPNYTAPGNPDIPTPIPTPEVTLMENEPKERDLKKASIIGGVIGGATVLAAGTGIVVPAVIACSVTGLASRGLEWVGGKRVAVLDQRITAARENGDDATATKLEKRKEGWNKVRNACKYITRFFGGAAIGVGIGAMVSNIALGGHGLIWNRPEPIIPTSTNPAGPSHIEPRTLVDNPATTGPESQPFDSGLLQNGRVNLPGDVSDGNLATGPVGNLPGGAENFNNYAGGQSDMGWYRLNEYLNNAQIKASDLAAAGGDIHRMGYALQVDPTRTLPDLLNQFGGSSLLQ